MNTLLTRYDAGFIRILHQHFISRWWNGKSVVWRRLGEDFFVIQS